MDYKYVRIQGQEIAKHTYFAKGIFSMCMDLMKEENVEQEDAELLKALDDWFSEELPYPPQCNNKEPVVCYFKTENTVEMRKMIRPMEWLLEKYNHPYFVVYTNTPGEIVYEDHYQVAVKLDDVNMLAQMKKMGFIKE